MAAKRKQDDKHLKLLREMVSREHNKTCFECNQRGPTYVDMTIGTFVCTACSGILRGINPPHRVKSISMASYTTQEIEFLEKNGNEVCRHIWLGLYDSKSQPGPESKEDGKVRDYLVQKYEKKRWYVEPSQATILAAAKAKEAAEVADRKSTSSSHSTPEPKPLKSLIGSNVAPIRVSQPPGHSASTHNISKTPTLAQTANKQKSVDLLADLGADPFASTAQPAGGGFGQAPFGQPAQQTPFGQPAQQGAFGQAPAQQQTPFGQQAAFGQPSQQAAFGQPAQQAAFGQPAQQAGFGQPAAAQQGGGFADFSQAFGGAPSQTSQAFMPAPQAAQAAFPTPQAPAASAASTNNFGAFESAFTPQAAPVPIPAASASSSAPTLNPTVQGLHGLSLSNSTPPSGGGAVASSTGGGAAGNGGGDKYAAFASLGEDTGASASINWSGGGASSAPSGGSGIAWGGGGGGGGAGLAGKSPSSSGIDWGTGMPKSQGQPMPGMGSLSATSLGGTATVPSSTMGSVPFGAATAQGNPFMAMSSSGATPATSTMVTNPFLGAGVAPATSMGGPAQPNGLFGMPATSMGVGMPNQNPMMMGGAAAGFNMIPPQQPGVQGGGVMQMNGRVAGAGYPQGQMGGAGGAFGTPPQAMPNQFGMPVSMGAPTQPQQGALSFGGAGMAQMGALKFNQLGQPTAPGGVPAGQGFGSFGAPQQPTPQAQQFAWGAAPNALPQQHAMAPNPFMQASGVGQGAIPPKSNASNPFL